DEQNVFTAIAIPEVAKNKAAYGTCQVACKQDGVRQNHPYEGTHLVVEKQVWENQTGSSAVEQEVVVFHHRAQKTRNEHFSALLGRRFLGNWSISGGGLSRSERLSWTATTTFHFCHLRLLCCSK